MTPTQKLPYVKSGWFRGCMVGFGDSEAHKYGKQFVDAFYAAKNKGGRLISNRTASKIILEDKVLLEDKFDHHFPGDEKMETRGWRDYEDAWPVWTGTIVAHPRANGEIGDTIVYTDPKTGDRYILDTRNFKGEKGIALVLETGKYNIEQERRPSNRFDYVFLPKSEIWVVPNFPQTGRTVMKPLGEPEPSEWHEISDCVSDGYTDVLLTHYSDSKRITGSFMGSPAYMDVDVKIKGDWELCRIESEKIGPVVRGTTDFCDRCNMPRQKTIYLNHLPSEYMGAIIESI